jgi:predicted enzyme related to lactoylglutathione lyase
MSYTPGRFVWCELVTPSPEDGIAFWTEVAGFTVDTMKMAEGRDYSMLKKGDKTVGGVVRPQMEGTPPHFTQYVSVADVGAASEAVVKHGGQVLVPATDIGMGVFAVVTDPQGAAFQLWRSATGDDGAAAAVCWNELWAKDAGAVRGFYEGVLGWKHELMDMPQGAYHIFKVGEAQAAGGMNSPDPRVPPMWMPYLEVDDVDAVVARVKRHGGAVHAEAMEIAGIGRFAIVADRQGATAGVLKPA